MADSARYALHRPEMTELARCAATRKSRSAFRGSALRYRAKRGSDRADCDHPFVYRMVEGWAVPRPLRCRMGATSASSFSCPAICSR